MDKKEQQKKEAASRKEENRVVSMDQMEAALDMLLTYAYYSLYHPDKILRRLDADCGEMLIFPKTIH